MNIRLVILAAAGALSTAAVGETVIPVSNTVGFVELDAATDVPKLTASTIRQIGYPTAVGDPSFWLDCTRTNDWTFAPDGSVAKIPSRVGDRYLATDTEGGIHQIAWTPQNPLWATDNAPSGGGYLDFGPKGALRAMSFNKVGPAGFETNVLENIGTVVAVWYSAINPDTPDGEGGYYGGALLGGGFGTDGTSETVKDQYVNYRETANDRASAAESVSWRPRWHDNPLASSSHTHYALRAGWVRHNGQATAATIAGFAGDWEVVSLVPNAEHGLMNATGLGMNDARIPGVSGGFKVAEMLFYDKTLTLDETKLVEAYLNAKWFGTSARGFNGTSGAGRLRALRNEAGRPVGARLSVDVADGETLTVDKLQGGRGPDAAIVKTGAGTLEIGDASAYGGAIELGGGTLAFAGRKIPTELPHTDYLHFDPSSAASLVTDDAGNFSLLRNLTRTTTWKGEPVCARPDGFVPGIRADELGEGLSVLDFGDYKGDDLTRMIYFATNETAAVQDVRATPDGFTTILAVVGAARGGGTLVKAQAGAGYFSRNGADDFTLNLMTNVSVVANLSAHEHATAFVNGVAASPSQGFEGPGYQVIAIRTPGTNPATGLGGSAWGSGGLRLGEIVVYRRALTDQEMRDGSAYLMKKWLGKAAPGYAAPTEAVAPTLRKLVATGDAAVRVESGTVRVGTVASEGGVLTKTGAGTLAYEALAAEEVRVEAGAFVKRTPADVASAVCAADPALHLDVADAASLRVVETDGERRVLEWYSKGDRTVMAVPGRIEGSRGYAADRYAPYLTSDVRLNGHDTVDFGPFAVDRGGRALTLSRSFDAVRHAYIVWCPRDAGDSRGQFLGCSNGNGETNGNYYDFLRGTTDEAGKATATLLSGNQTTGPVQDGTTLTNGVAVTPTDYVPPPGVFTVTEFHPAAGVHISGLANDRDVARFAGGIRVAEVILYERDLTAREQVATRNYLMQKWFGAAPAALPDPVETADSLRRITVDGAAEFATDGSLDVEALVGAGTFVKKGTGTLTLLDPTAFTGTVSVAEGTLACGGTTPAAFGGLVAPEDLLFHVDAGQGLATVTNDDGRVEVTEWKSTLDDGWAAVPFEDENRPTLVRADDLRRRDVVDMAKNARQAMRFTQNGTTSLLEGIASAFWVIGSQNGGGYLLGGGHHNINWDGGRFNFMRGGSGGARADDPILSSEWVCPDNLKTADWRLDGAAVVPTVTGLSGSWDLVSMNITDTRNPTSNADGFAFDGRTVDDGGGLESRLGCQRLAEVILYRRRLTDAERESVEAYLRAKWRLGGTLAMTNLTDVALAAGATLDLGGRRQYFASVTGAGTIRNGTLALGTLIADPEVEVPTCAADAVLEVAEGQRVLVRNAAVTRDTVLTVAEGRLATSVTRKRLRTAVFAFENCTGPVVDAHLVKEDDCLKVRFVHRGALLIVR